MLLKDAIKKSKKSNVEHLFVRYKDGKWESSIWQQDLKYFQDVDVIKYEECETDCCYMGGDSFKAKAVYIKLDEDQCKLVKQDMYKK